MTKNNGITWCHATALSGMFGQPYLFKKLETASDEHSSQLFILKFFAGSDHSEVGSGQYRPLEDLLSFSKSILSFS